MHVNLCAECFGQQTNDRTSRPLSAEAARSENRDPNYQAMKKALESRTLFMVGDEGLEPPTLSV